MEQVAEGIAATSLSQALVAAGWAVPTLQVVHLVSIAILFASVVMVDLRVLGFTGHSQTVLQTLRRFAPWFWGAFTILALSGLMMIAAEPRRELMSVSFWLKMTLVTFGVGVAAAAGRYARASPSLRAVGTAPGFAGAEEPPAVVRLLGWAILALWTAIIFLGRFIAYDPQIWGPLSPLY